MMVERNRDGFRSAILTLVFFLLLPSASAGDMLLRHKSDEVRIKEMTFGVTEGPSDSSLAVAEDIIGMWNAMPTVSESLARNPDMIWRSINFQTNGIVEISYELVGKRLTQQFSGLYEIVHKATKGRGNPPNIVIRSRNAQDKKINILVNVRIGEFSYFPPDVPVLWFQDADGYHHVFEPVDISPEKRVKLLRRSSAELKDVIPKQGEGHGGQSADADMIRQICARLENAELQDVERNKEILRLMNEGDATCVPILIRHLKAEYSLVVRQNAIRALGKVGDKRALSPLLDILRNPVQGDVKDDAENEAILRRNAVVALDDLGDVAALPVLETVAESAREYRSVRDLARITSRKMQSK